MVRDTVSDHLVNQWGGKNPRFTLCPDQLSSPCLMYVLYVSILQTR
jgi:hypothetical protein